jgi:hypothetical protein
VEFAAFCRHRSAEEGRNDNKYPANEGDAKMKRTLALFAILIISLSLSNLHFSASPVRVFAQPIELAYDDGKAEKWWSKSAGGLGEFYAVLFSPQFESHIVGVKYYIYSNPSSFNVLVLDSDRNAVFEKVAIATSPGWFTMDLSKESIVVKGEFYAAMKWTISDKPRLGADESNPHGRSFIFDGGHWYTYREGRLQLTGENVDGDFMIRVMVEASTTTKPTVTSSSTSVTTKVTTPSSTATYVTVESPTTTRVTVETTTRTEAPTTETAAAPAVLTGIPFDTLGLAGLATAVALISSVLVLMRRRKGPPGGAALKQKIVLKAGVTEEAPREPQPKEIAAAELKVPVRFCINCGAEMLADALYCPSCAAGTLAFVSDKTLGLERLEHAAIQASVIVRHMEVKIGEDATIELQMINAGKKPATLVKIENVVPAGFELVSAPEPYRLVGDDLLLKGRRLDAMKTEEIELVLRPKRKGSFLLKPRIFYLDENGNYRYHEPDPVTIKVKEIGLRGWVTGPE